MISGVKIIESIDGVGEEAQKGDKVEFDSKGYLSRGECIQERLCITTTLGKRELIAGIEYALVGIKTGGYRKIKISPHLAFRDEGLEGKIPPDAVLIYELWVNRIEKTKRTQKHLTENGGVGGDEFCTCPCHEHPHAVVHPVPCCETCPKCKRGIVRGRMEEHLRVCTGKRKK